MMKHASSVHAAVVSCMLVVVLCPMLFASEGKTVTQAWSEAIARIDYDALSESIRRKTILSLADAVGVMTFTADVEEVRRFQRVALLEEGGGNATEFVTGRKVSMMQAAAINAFAIHGYEIDDSNMRNNIRASCVAIPAPLALAEYRNLTGREFLTALAISYHVTDRLGLFMNAQPAGALHHRGLMPSSLCGVVGAAAGAGKAMGLREDALVSAMGLAAGGANGLFQYYLDGSDEKKVHVARSQRLAVESVLLARQGVRGAAGGVDGMAGLLNVFGFPPDRKKLNEHFDRFDGVRYVKPKFYACSQSVIPWLEVLAPILRREHVRHQDVERVELHFNASEDDGYFRRINHFRAPVSLIDAQLSPNYGIALMLVKGDAFVEDWTDGNLKDQTILALAGKVSAHTAKTANGTLKLILKDGVMFSGEYSLTAFRDPYEPDVTQYRGKFRRLSAKRLNAQEGDRLWNHVLQIEEVESMQDWCARLKMLMKLPDRPRGGF